MVSVIVPTYNRAHLLTETLDTVWNQGYRPIELLVVDDGSTDETEDVVASWAGRCKGDSDFSLRYFYQPNQGAPSARNFGARMARGEYIQFLDSDDKLATNKLQLQTAVLEETGASLFYSLSQTFGTRAVTDSSHFGNGQERLIGFDAVELGMSEVIRRPMYQNSAALYPRETCCQAGPWDESLEGGQDWEYSVRALLVAQSDMIFQSLVLNHVRCHDGPSVTTSGVSFLIGKHKALQRVSRMLESGEFEIDCEVQSSLGFSFCRQAFRFHDFGRPSYVQKALRAAESYSPWCWPAKVLAECHRLSPRLLDYMIPVLRWIHRNSTKLRWSYLRSIGSKSAHYISPYLWLENLQAYVPSL